MIYTMKKKQERKVYMTIKIDLEKACDKNKWSSIIEVLGEVGISYQLHAMIMDCITFSNMNILLDGANTKEFKLGRCIRQRDPISLLVCTIQ